MTVTAGARVGAFVAACFAGGAVLTGFLPLFLADRGLAPGTIGLLLGAGSLVRVVAVPGWGLAADRSRSLRAPLLVASLAAAATAALYPATVLLPVLALLVTVNSVAAAALTPLADTLTVALAAAGRLVYGRTRAGGSVAYMLATAAAGPLVAWAGSGVVPLLAASAFAVAAALVPALPARPATPPRARAIEAGLFRRPDFRLILAASALVQGSHGAYYGFAALHWRQAGLGDTVIGLLIAEGITMEIVLFVWGAGLARRLGPAGLTALAATSCLVRWSALGLTASLPVLVATQLLHAGSFAMQHLSSMAVMRQMPPGRAAAAQTLHSALGFSAPTGLLIWLTGLLYAGWGGGVFFLMAAMGGAALLLVTPLWRATRACGICEQRS